MIELPLEAAEGADISWDAVQPVTLDFRITPSGVLYTHSVYAVNGKIVVRSDVIDWEARKRDKTTWIVTVQGNVPTPPPPVDPNVPTPPVDPNVPLPNTVPDFFGVGGIAYREALKIGRPAEAATLSQEFQTSYMNLHMGKWLPEQAAKYMNDVVGRLPAQWHPWINAVNVALAAARAKHGSGITQQRDMFREVSDALNVASKSAPTSLTLPRRSVRVGSLPDIWAIAP